MLPPQENPPGSGSGATDRIPVSTPHY